MTRLSSPVDGSTRVYALLGHPVQHSLSPLIQNAAFRATGMNAVYVALDVPPGRLAEATRGLHAAGVAGLNLTAPHKEAAFPLASGHTSEALEARAVNTFRWEEGGWLGHATDGIGFSSWVMAERVGVSGKRVLLIGAGGAARSILPRLCSLGAAEVMVVSRTGARARALAQAIAGGGATSIASASIRDEARAAGGGWELLIRAIPEASIAADEDRWWRSLNATAAVLDLNYGERSAAVRRRTLAEGRRHEDGIPLLVHQGAASFEFWTRRAAPLGAMTDAVTGPSARRGC